MAAGDHPPTMRYVDSADELDQLEPLWTALQEHHAEIDPVLAGRAPKRDNRDAWRKRRSKYESWLGDPDTFFVLAEQGEPVGYAFVTVGPGYASWRTGERIAELETLSVLPSHRGSGLGARLVEAVWERLGELGVEDLAVTTVKTNVDARRFYEREGFSESFVVYYERERPTVADPGGAPGVGEGGAAPGAVADSRFVPAAGRRWMTGLYDSIIATTMRERAFRGALEERVAAGMPSGGRVVDVGSGTGTFAIALAARLPGAEVIGVEPDEETHAIALRKAGSGAVEWRAGFADSLPVEDESCDRVTMSLLLHHLEPDAKRAALSEAHRVLRRGGRLCVADWGRPGDPVMRAAFFVLQLFDGFAPTRDHAAGRLPAFIEAAGFTEVERHERLRTGLGVLEILSASRP